MNIVTLCGVGHLPKAPGTWGTLAAMPLVFLPPEYMFDILLSFIIVFTIISIPIIDKIEEKYSSDPSFVVIDEAIGIWIVMLLPYFHSDILIMVEGFILFRVLDIFKPFPISYFNNKRGGFYVIADDLVAGLGTVLILLIQSLFFL
jgi:phosphatidylglycerophosphatase A